MTFTLSNSEMSTEIRSFRSWLTCVPVRDAAACSFLSCEVMRLKHLIKKPSVVHTHVYVNIAYYLNKLLICYFPNTYSNLHILKDVASLGLL